MDVARLGVADERLDHPAQRSRSTDVWTVQAGVGPRSAGRGGSARRMGFAIKREYRFRSSRHEAVRFRSGLLVIFFNRRAVLGALIGLFALAVTPVIARTVTDSAGRSIEIPDKISRVFAAGPPASVLL